MVCSFLLGLFSIFLVVSECVGNKLADSPAHAIYIAVIEIDHKNPQRPAEVKIKVFTDDLEDALRNAFGKPFKLPDGPACDQEQANIEAYFQEHFKMDIDGDLAALSYEKGENNGDSTWLYFSLDGPSKWRKLLITADFFMELFPTQATTLTIYENGAMWFKKFTKGESICRVAL